MNSTPVNFGREPESVLKTLVNADSGNIPTAFVFLSSEKKNLKSFMGKIGDFGQLTSDSVSPPAGTHLFNKIDKTFLSFSHSIGWRKANQAHYHLEVIDPTKTFEVEFIEPYFYSRNANTMNKPFYITYGHGRDRINWSPVQLVYLVKIDVDILSSGARKYNITFGSMPSMCRRPDRDGWPILDDWGRLILTAGKAGFNDKDAVALLEGHWLAAVHAGRTQVSAYTRKSRGHGFLDFLDEAIFLCIQRYIENVTGYEGNVVVLLPSLSHTGVSERLWKMVGPEAFDRGSFNFNIPNLGQQAAMEGMAEEKSKGDIHYLSDIRKTIRYLLQKFTDLDCFSIPEMKKARGTKYHAIKRPSTMIGIEKQKLRPTSDSVLMFQISNSDVKRDNNFRESAMDWLKPLERFGHQFANSLVAVDDVYLNKYQVDSFIVNNRPTFGKMKYTEIEDVDQLATLHEAGIIKNPSERCFIWGEDNMIKLFLGDLPTGEYVYGELKETQSRFYRAVKSMFITGGNVELRRRTLPEERAEKETRLGQGVDEGNPLINTTAPEIYDAINGEKNTRGRNYLKYINNRSSLIEYYGNYASLKAQTKQTLQNMEALVNEKSDANYIKIESDKYIPILRSNTRNANVTDARMQLNPHYWGNLAGVTESEAVKVTKGEDSVIGEQILPVLEKALLKHMGWDENDKDWKEMMALVRQGNLWEAFRDPIAVSSPQAVVHLINAIRTSGFIAPGVESPKDLSKNQKTFLTEIVKSFISGNRKIYNKVFGEAKSNALMHTALFYEQLYNMAGPQMDVTTIPMFYYSTMTDVGKHMFLLMKQPSILGSERMATVMGSEGDVDKLALNRERKRQKQYSSFMTGLYTLIAFENRITKTSVDSRFRLTKHPYTADEESIRQLAYLIEATENAYRRQDSGKSPKLAVEGGESRADNLAFPRFSREFLMGGQ
jgi:hypothetical protein